jgi:thiamine-monophosphate kinase
LVTTDLLVEDVHFPGGRFHPALLGRKAFRVNVSDIAAMGGEPLACFLGLAWPPELPMEDFTSLVDGFVDESERFGTVLAGGDLSRSDRLTIAVTVLGGVPDGEPLGRNGARPGDLLLLIGRLGYSRLGLQAIKADPELDLRDVSNERELGRKFSPGPLRDALEAHLLPPVYLAEARWLQQHGLANAMVDVSDGLLADVGHLCEMSSLTAVIVAEKVPVPRAAGEPPEALDCALNGGEDYALAISASPEQWATISSSYPADLAAPVVIGRFEAGRPRVLIEDAGGARISLSRGYDHFRGADC